jgi:homospermidine synthase
MASIKSFREFVEQPKEKFAHFSKKILIIGYGSVGQAILPMVLNHITTDPKNVTVLEKDDHTKLFKKRNARNGVRYVRKEILRNNLDSTLSKYVEDGGFLIDVSLNIDAQSIMEWCFEHNVMYINTSLERWADHSDEKIKNLADRTLYATHKEIRNFASKYPNAATCVATHGANPGLVTHLTKRALLELSKKNGKTIEAPTDREGWAALMKKLKVKVVHVAERDTQILDVPKEKDEFVNMWSCEGFWAEGRAPAEMGWGTHENKNPVGGKSQGNTAYLEQPGLSVLMKSWVPKGGSYNGFCVQHSESVTISEYFTTKDNSFRPSVYYVYQPSDAAIASVHEMRGHELDLQSKTRIAKDEIISGIDELGVLLIGDTFAMWHGSQLSIEEARKLIPGENATSVQVVASMLGAIMYAIQNPRLGYIEPESIPFDFVLKYADPYLGPTPAEMTDWRPNKDINSLFYREYDAKNPCSFENFRVDT